MADSERDTRRAYHQVTVTELGLIDATLPITSETLT